MSALKLFDITPKFNIMFVMFADELFVGSQTMFYRVLVWVGRVGISSTIDPARILHNKYLCSKFLGK
jgi:hypothetical protein